MKIIDGKQLAEKINDATVAEILKLGSRPNLAVILVGENPDSKIYVKKKLEASKKVGVDTHFYKCDADMGEAKLVEMIEFLNKDDAVDAILLQLPLPKEGGYNTDEIITKISPEKDVDCFHPKNIEPIVTACSDEHILPPVYGVIFDMLKSLKFDLKGKKVVVVSKSEIFGGNLAKIFKCKGAVAEKVHPDDPELIAKASQADVLIPVIGRPKFIKKEMIKPGAVVIDVGITREEGFTYGDVDFSDVKDLDGYISPVPGGVGPMTVAITLRNTLDLHKKRRNK
ncbi:MAG: tetrahydrofolate dehydrogenase/cyclohydrolase catalytic domain-containing protein [Patescibacteria group bacterium]|jgi:methylenetetrahydrofolate dehydrogenase (NADP+)/methenyltetrahydrofolate cyclohydrolase